MEIKQIHGYSIHTVKKENCQNLNYGYKITLALAPPFIIGVMGPICACIFGIMEYLLYGMIAGVVWMVIGLEICRVTLNVTPRCGCEITMYNPRRECVNTKEYIFSGNADIDAENIKKIIGQFEQNANSLKEEYERERKERKLQAENSERCCNQYKTVMERVKS